MSVLQTKSGLRKYTIDQINQINPTFTACAPPSMTLSGFPIERFFSFQSGVLNGDVKYDTGIWTCEISCINFSTYSNEHELSIFLKGKARIYDTADNQFIELIQGDILYIPPNGVYRYDVIEKVTKSYMYINLNNSPCYLDKWLYSETPEFKQLEERFKNS